jgi:hypothetical protein
MACRETLVGFTARAALTAKTYNVRGTALGESAPNLARERARLERLADDAALADAH